MAIIAQPLPLHAATKPATVNLLGLQLVYNGSPQAVTVATNPVGLSFTITYSSAAYPSSTKPPTTAGSYNVLATVNGALYSGSATGILVINKALASVVLSNLSATYNGSGQSATATTSPPGLSVSVSYDASSTLPINAGSHAVKATVSDPNYSGATTGTLTIVPAKATVTLTTSSLSSIYNHTPVSVSATTVPQGLPVIFSYSGRTSPPVDVGTYTVTASVLSPNGTGSTTGTLVILPAPATVTLGNLNTVFTGHPIMPTATTLPVNLPLQFAYNGIPNKPPSAVGAYAVVATISNPDYVGSGVGTLVIAKPVSFGATPPAPLLDASGAWVSLGVNPGGLTTTAYFIVSTDPTFATYTQTPNQYLPNGHSQTTISGFLGQLQPSTTYYYEMVTVSAAGTFASSVQSFTTLGFDTTLIAATGTSAPGTTFSFATLGNAAVDAEDGAAFYATLSGPGITPGNNAGIWANHGSTTLNLLAQTGAIAPDTGGSLWTNLGDTVYNNNEDVAFGGTLAASTTVSPANKNGIWASTGGTLGLIARQGSIAPGTGGAVFATFNAIGLCDNGFVVLSATLADSLSTGVSLANNAGVWEGSNGANLTLVLRTGQQTNLGKTIAGFTLLPLENGLNGQTRSFGSATGHLVANTTQTDHSTSIVKVLSSGLPVAVATSGDSAVGTAGATFVSFSNAAINNSDHVAFVGALKVGTGDATNSNAAGIWADDSTGARHMIARLGQPAPSVSTGATFTAFGDPLYNDDNNVAFLGTCHVGAGQTSATTFTGIWSNSTGSLALVAQQGNSAPGCPAGVTFASFPQLALDDGGGAIFVATLAGVGVNTANNTGIFAVDATGELQLIVRTSDVLNGNTVTALNFLSSGFLISGQTRSFSPSTGDLIYTATFSDRTQAIFNVVFP